MRLNVLLSDIRSCTICAEHLPLGPKPLLQAAPSARLLIIGQAPGSIAHTTGVPWNDRSGRRLREWLGLDDETFYDPKSVAVAPMGFCFPGTGKGGDLPPRPECAQTWHEPLQKTLKKIELTVLVGRYAFEHKIGDRFATLTDAVATWDELLPKLIVLPHPSPRNNRWLAKNPWFERDTLPALRSRVREIHSPPAT